MFELLVIVASLFKVIKTGAGSFGGAGVLFWPGLCLLLCLAAAFVQGICGFDILAGTDFLIFPAGKNTVCIGETDFSYSFHSSAAGFADQVSVEAKILHPMINHADLLFHGSPVGDAESF